MAKVLIYYGAHFFFLIQGEAPLTTASKNRYVDVVKILLKQSLLDVDFQDDEGRTALSYTAESNHSEVVQCLKDRGAT